MTLLATAQLLLAILRCFKQLLRLLLVQSGQEGERILGGFCDEAY